MDRLGMAQHMALYLLRYFIRYFVCHNGVFVDDISNSFLRQPVVLSVRKKLVTGFMCQIQPVLGDICFYERSRFFFTGIASTF